MRSPSSAPINVAILGKYEPIADAPFNDAGWWVVWQDEQGWWYGDHHSSFTATEREAPIGWLPLPDVEKSNDE